jgi:hypothetical protein
MMLAGILAWSIRNQALPPWRFRIRTLMLIVAALPVSWLAGQKVRNIWQRFDDYCNYAGRVSPYAELESRLKQSPEDPPVSVYGVEADSDSGK